MTTEGQSLYNSANTVITVAEDIYGRRQKELRQMRRGYCAMPLETDKYAYASMHVLANELSGVAEYEDSEALLGKKDTVDTELGSVLLKACVVDLKASGYNTLLFHGATEQEITFCQQLGAENSITILEHDNTIAPLTLDQVLQATKYMDEEFHTSQEFGSGSYVPEYFDIFLDLESIDAQGWQQPVEQDPYLAQFRKTS